MGTFGSTNISLNSLKNEFGSSTASMSDVFAKATDQGNYHQQNLGLSSNSNLYTNVSIYSPYGTSSDMSQAAFANYNSDTQFMFQVDFNVMLPNWDITFDLYVNDGLTTPGTFFAGGGGPYNIFSGPQAWVGPAGPLNVETTFPGGYYIWVDCTATYTGGGRTPVNPVTFVVQSYGDLFPAGATQVIGAENVNGWDLNNTGPISQNGFYDTSFNTIPWNRCIRIDVVIQ